MAANRVIITAVQEDHIQNNTILSKERMKQIEERFLVTRLDGDVADDKSKMYVANRLDRWTISEADTLYVR